MPYNSWSNWYNDITDEDLCLAQDTINFLNEKIAHFKIDNENNKHKRKIDRLELSVRTIKYYFGME